MKKILLSAAIVALVLLPYARPSLESLSLECIPPQMDEQTKKYGIEHLWKEPKSKFLDKLMAYKQCEKLGGEAAVYECQDKYAIEGYDVIVEFLNDLLNKISKEVANTIHKTVFKKCVIDIYR